MKADQSLLCTLCAVVYCALHLTDAAKEPRKLNWKSTADQSENTGLNYKWISPSKHGQTITLNKTLDNDQPENVPKQDINQKVLATLQDLSQQEIKSLFSLVSSKENSKPDQALRSKKIVNLFDGNKSLLRSLNNELTSLPQNSTRNNRIQDLTSILRRLRQRAPTVRRMTEVAPEEETVEEKNIGIADVLIDPRAINDGLMQGFSYSSILSNSRRRNKRSAKLVHKLIRISPPNVTAIPLLRENTPVDLKLNTTSFVGPSPKSDREPEYLSYNTTMSYEQIEDLAFADLNGTEVELSGNNTDDEQLPSPEELVAGPRYRTSTKHRTTYIKPDIKRKRIPIRSYATPVLQKKCERFTASMCIKADDYPMDQIMGSIRRHKNAMSALLAEYHDKAAELEYQEQLEEYQFNSKRREDGNVVTPGGMCASVIRYARPQKARSASGEWKYIVNTGRHTQTLRLEKCSTPQESCSYLSHNFRSRCTQVYNYHRLLSWDQSRGLHVDIFKVPTCCSCQVDGYRETFPPLGGSKLKEYKDYTPVPNNNPYSSMNDDIDYEDEDSDDMSIPYQFSGALKRNKHDHYHHSELLLGSTNINTKVNPPRLNPTVGSYLSPPTDLYDSEVSSKSVRPPYFTHSSKTQNGRSRKPFKHFVPNESRVDLEISGSEHSDKEVKAYDSTRAHQKRTRVYPGPSNIETPYHTSRPIVASEPVSGFIPTTELTTRHTGQSANTNSNNRKEPTGNGKRINYNYHPIIDFFENHQKSGKAQIMGRNNPSNSIPISSEVITSRDRRIGLSGLENNWHPMVLNS